MAYTTYGNSVATSSSLRDRALARVDALRGEWAKWRLYRKTFNELQSLSNRDLNDLGLSRAGIRAVALEAAYGEK